MRLVDELKNGVSLMLGMLAGALLIIPVAIVQLAMLPFEEPDTPEDVARVLRKCINGADDAEDDFDNFTSRKIADPRLDQIKSEMLALASADWGAEQTREGFRQLLRRVDAMAKIPNA